MNTREQRIERGAEAIMKRASWPSLHWPDVSALAHRDVAVAMATAVIDSIPAPPDSGEGDQ